MPALLIPANLSDALERAAFRHGVAAHLRESLIAYIRSGRPTGGFLQAVLSNDLLGACQRGDDESRSNLVALVAFLESVAPIVCWGSPLAYREWISRGAAARDSEAR